MSAAEHRDPPPVKRGDIPQALEVAAALRNVYSIEEGEGETPVIVEIGALPPEGHPDREKWEITDWRFEVHVSCGDHCPVLAVVPYDFDADYPHRKIAEAIAQAGEVILGLVSRISVLEAENAGLRARVAELETSLDEAVNAEGGLYDKIEHDLLTALGFPDGTLDEAAAEAKRLRDIVKEVEKVLGEDPSPRDVRVALGEPPAPLRLGRGPTKEEFRKHGATGGGWMLQGVGEDLAGWAMEMRQIPEADLDAMVRFTRDAIPLNAARQPCGVGEGT